MLLRNFEASVDGELYDPNRWANFYRPYGMDVPEGAIANGSVVSSTTTNQKAPVAESAPKVEAEPVAAPVAEEATSNAGADASDILAMIRNRKTD